MTLVSAVAYHGLAVIALLIHFLAFGLYVLITMALTAPPDMELPAVIVKLIIVAGWVVLLGFGLSEWRGHRLGGGRRPAFWRWPSSGSLVPSGGPGSGGTSTWVVPEATMKPSRGVRVESVGQRGGRMVARRWRGRPRRRCEESPSSAAQGGG